MSRVSIFLACFFLVSLAAIAQGPVQVIRGRVVDAASRAGLAGVNIVVMQSDPVQGATTDVDGYFLIPDVKVGRHSFSVSCIGYRTLIVPEVMVSSGRQPFLNIELEEMVYTAKEVEIKAGISKGQAINPMAIISARSFTVDETRRYAGSMDDPMRAVSNFAGVAANAGVNSNQIMVRGNSPRGLLWRVEGMDIPNPNHFAFVGTSGGGFTIFSSQVLANSDFYTAAFPAQYGNALSGVFDMRFRNGNNTRHEYAFQVGVQGIDIAAEGPFTKEHTSSYLFNYRYSILYFLRYIDASLKNQIPSFQDLSFKMQFPTAKAGTFSIVGIGGASAIKGEALTDSADWKTLDNRTTSSLKNRMGAMGVIHQAFVTKKASLRTAVYATYTDVISDALLYDSGYISHPVDSTMYRHYRLTGAVSYNQKIRARYTMRAGVAYTELFYDLDMKQQNPFTGIFGLLNYGRGHAGLVQAFTEARMDLTSNLTATAGIFFQFFRLNGHTSLEPRFALRWQAAPRHALSLGYGLHSQMEDIGLYLADVPGDSGTTSKANKDLNFSKAHHVVLGYDFQVSTYLRLKVETYYQYLFKVPVMPGSYYSLINSDGTYFNDSLINGGTGRNLGIDITFEKFLTRQYYYLATVSLFTSNYEGGDGVDRNSRYNSGYVVNLLGGKEWTIRSKNILGLNLKGSFTGGEHYVPINLQASITGHREVLDETAAYRPQLPSTFYLDFTVTYRTNHRKFSGIWALQIRNLLNQKPTVGYIYNDYARAVQPVTSLGIIPLLSYKVEF